MRAERWAHLGLLIGTLMLAPSATALEDAASAPRLPAFTQTNSGTWLNGPPLKVEDLRGSVVLLDFWAFECWNCYRSFPWLNGVGERYTARGLKLIGVHTPEFEREKSRAALAEKILQFKITYPVMMDNDFGYWRALGNQYWPAFYLIDRKGRLRALHIGETHAGTPQAKRIEANIEALLAESAP